MPIKRIQLTLVIAMSVLFSCNNKKHQTTDYTKAAATTIDSVEILPDEEFMLSEYASSFNDAVTQKFSISSTKKSVVTGKKGLRITVDPLVLEKENGAVADGKIIVRLIELTNSEDLFKSNAATVSNGRLLMSGGSYFIGMECNGEKLRIKKDKNLKVEFPRLKEDEMQLFYGERDTLQTMNWRRAGVALEEPEQEMVFTDTSGTNDSIPAGLAKYLESTFYQSLNDEVYLYDKNMTIKTLVDSLNKRTAKIYIDTVYLWPKNLPTNTKLDTSYLISLYGARKQYRLKTCHALEEEAAAALIRKQQQQQAIAMWQPKSLSGQLQQYYAPSSIVRLGWINCDKYYQWQERTDVNLDIPITLNNSRVQYFLIYRSFNGMMNISDGNKQSDRSILKDLPVGESVTLVAFTKFNGQLFECKEDFVIHKNKTVSLGFKTISVEEIKKKFGNNVRI